jgi:hypothetical protein
MEWIARELSRPHVRAVYPLPWPTSIGDAPTAMFQPLRWSLAELSPAWFADHLTEVIAAAGPRCSSGLNVDLPIALRFDALGYTQVFLDRLSATRRDYRKGRNKAIDSLKRIAGTADLAAARKRLQASGTALLTSLSRFGDSPPPTDLTDEVLTAARQAGDAME